MPLITTAIRMLCFTLSAIVLTACYKPPYNNFEPASPLVVDEEHGQFKMRNFFTNKKRLLLQKLSRADIQYVQYGDTHTFLIPSDRYFEFDSPKMNDICYTTFLDILLFLKMYPCSTIYIAGFSDAEGSTVHQQKLSHARAETLLTYLWANGFKSSRLRAEGYGAQYPIANNKLVHGAAYNRRIEIQWYQMHGCRQAAHKKLPSHDAYTK